MPGAIGANLRVTGHSSQGGRKYMEDFFSVAYQQSEDERDLEYAFFGIFDGHGGSEAAAYAKEHLMRSIVNQKQFWSDNDADVLRAIREGYIATHKAMWREQEKWPRTATGLPSTAGTTATVAFIRHGKIYIGHVGDSGIVLGYQDPEGAADWKAKPLTQDHKPECDIEKARIVTSGGKVVAKSGVSRVVWTRPRLGHKGPIRRSTPIDEIPFLAVARSLGDLWSYNSQRNEFVVSPDPDTLVVPIEKNFRCLVFGTDGLWNVLTPSAVVDIVRNAEFMNDRNYYCSKELLNPSRCLVNRALEKWSTTRIRADNTTVVTILLDPPGGPKRKQRETLYTMGAGQSTAGHCGAGGVGAYDDWHTMDEECLNGPAAIRGRPSNSAARNVEEELESLYNQTHQYQDHLGGNSFHHHQFGGSSTAVATVHNSNYENYMNLSSAPPGGFLQSHLQGSQHMLEAMAMAVQDYDINAAPPGAATGEADLENMGMGASTSAYGQQHHNNHHHQPQLNHLPTFSHLMEDTYSLTRLETRLEQLTNSAATSGSSMYANYQQLIETTTNYCPQIDLNTINTFHDYAGIPMAVMEQEQNQPEGVIVGQGEEGPIGTVDGMMLIGDNGEGATSEDHQLNYSMEMNEKFTGWSPEKAEHETWNQQEDQSIHLPSTSAAGGAPVAIAEEEKEGSSQPTDSAIRPCAIEISSSSSTGNKAAEPPGSLNSPLLNEKEEENLDNSSTDFLSSIQINEITSSGVVPTPPPPMASPSTQQPVDLNPTTSKEDGDISMEVDEQENAKVEVIKEEDNPQQQRVIRTRQTVMVSPLKRLRHPPQEEGQQNDNVPRRRLRCQKEKENKSRPTVMSSKVSRETRRMAAAEALTAVTTRRSAAAVAIAAASSSSGCSIATRKSAAMLLNNNTNNRTLMTRQTTKQAPTAAVKTKVDKLVSRRNLLINSSKFNQQTAENVLKSGPGGRSLDMAAAEAATNVMVVGRRLSKRDKVTKTINMAKKGGVAPSWRNVTKSTTVQTRNRVQKR